MPDQTTRFKTRFRNLLLIGIPYTIFYYPLDIYGLYPVAVFTAGACAWAAIAWRRAGRHPGQGAWKQGEARPKRGLPRIAKALLLLVAAAFVLNFGGHGMSPKRLSVDFLGLFMRPLMYPGILWALSRAGFALGVAAGGAVWALVALRRRTAAGAAAGAFWGAWAFVCFSLAAFTAFKLGPSRTWCEKADPQPGMRLLLSRAQIDALPGLRGALPYDAVSDPERGLLFVSLKQTSRRPGGIAAMQIPSGALLHTLVTDLPGNRPFSVNEFPERMAIDTARQRVYALVLCPANNHLLVASYENRRLALVSLIRLDGEPNNVYADERTGRIFVFYAAADRYGFAVYDAQTHEKIRESADPAFNGSAQHCVRDPRTGHLLITNLGKNKLIELDPETMRVVRTLDQRNPLQGLAHDPARNLVFATAPMTRTLEIKGRSGFRALAARRVRCGLADAAFDAPTSTVTVGGYTGAVDIFAARAPWRRAAALKIGHLLRNLHAAGNGRVYLCSGCGVFELDPRKATSN